MSDITVNFCRQGFIPTTLEFGATLTIRSLMFRIGLCYRCFKLYVNSLTASIDDLVRHGDVLEIVPV